MRTLTYSWIGLSAAAPLIFLMCAWVLGVFHSYRRQWRSVDLFLLAVFVQELLVALQVFAYALLSLMRPESSAACGAFVWSLSATRTLQAATVASLLVDRALTSQWPYKYRFSVRRHQIRYHLAVLATIAALVGVAAILARPADAPDAFEHCSFLPHALHVRLSLFVLSVYGLLVVAGGVSVGVVQAGRGCSDPTPAPSDMAPITATTTSSTSSSSGGGGRQGTALHAAASSASTTSSNASSARMGGVPGAMHAASSTSDLVPPPPPHRPPPALPCRTHKGVGVNRSSGAARTPASDFRWGTTLAVAALCFLVNHFPYMGLTVVGTFLPGYLPGWPVENMALWLSLAEGLLLPLVLGLVDATFSEAAGSSCSRNKPQPHKYDDGDGPFRLFPKEEVKSFPLTNGSLFSSLLNMSVDNPSQILPSYRRGGGAGMKMGVSSQEIRGLVGTGAPAGLRDPYGPPYFPREPTESLGSAATSSQDPIYSDPLSKVGSVDSSLKEDHIYATLSETFGSMSSLSDGYLGDDQRCASVTTVANDDFEFHDPRATVTPEPVRYTAESNNLADTCTMAIANRPPAKLPPEAHLSAPEDVYHLSTNTDSSTTYSVASSFRSSCSQVTATVENDTSYIKDDKKDDSDNPPEIGFYNTGFECDTLELKKEYFRDRGPVDSLDLRLSKERKEKTSDGTLSRKHRSSSLSMNDLDRLDTNPEKEEEMMFILPVKSESMLSLYRLYLAEDEAGTSLHYSVEVSRSEGDLSVLEAVENCAVGEGKSESALHEVYQKRRVPETTGSRVKRQHKIQRAKGMQQRARKTPTATSVSNHTSVLSNTGTVSNGMQVAVMDKTRRRNGIITIQDPSVLSVEELFRVLDRASCTPAAPYTDSGDPANSPLPAPAQRTEPDFKKIFVSEYL
ncbi:hypothetical protein OTU49_002901 [Cherax quadricarinatus]|uniref:G-protein coupled receptors family 1 profile domain-containing protein n=1 Tax=Cherax quadricarinatus TaxID=27406 RepID=A0AAW0XL79_CHEQU|nr:uncharacterized protein LOC128694004 [Cherax quadricarinatus]